MPKTRPVGPAASAVTEVEVLVRGTPSSKIATVLPTEATTEVAEPGRTSSGPKALFALVCTSPPTTGGCPSVRLRIA